jgi:L-alanine-DL-glutamate epimerase-like enolase superfamily enzyme
MNRGQGWTDADHRFTVGEAIRRARCLTPLDIAYLEVPLTGADVMGHVRLSQVTTPPVAIGESLYRHPRFREYLQQGACSIV